MPNLRNYGQRRTLITMRNATPSKQDDTFGDGYDDIISLLPKLRAFAWSLTRNGHDADDLVQDTLLKAIANHGKFQKGTNLRAWLFTIMRNTFYNRVHAAKRERTSANGCVAETVSTPDTQEWSVFGRELLAMIGQLPRKYREVLILVVMFGESYEDAATICNCAIGTIKSRVSRARALVMNKLGRDPV
ncbi:sigma-70 family RNA polymerase sigma factor [Defluviimonas sp. WL0002]|uniref:RNA polymerase sigma factor n=2 Tax=Albidovulum marisflavi TaxID=2984159 RepID=A0ABT2ZCU3_9RHOB|nr:sigma-70 family RNA polymerase sigma factor [Defluviimonas sp. WL0002]